jgi:phage terminase large subunit-like protein
MIEDLDLSREQKEQLLELLKEQDNRIKYNHIKTFFQDEGPLRRELYPKHMAFFKAGADYTERAFIAGNQTGKTTTGLCELYWHCSGDYPEWWEGKRFNKPIVAWLCGDRGELIRDSMQQDLAGRTEFGTGIIPLDKFAREPASLSGINGGYGQYFIKHVSGGVSKIIVKTYNSGKNAFEAAKVDVIMLDEECPMDIYVECQIRTITTGGIVYLTFTPDSGLTDTVLHFLKKVEAGEPAKFVTMVGWKDVPHISPERQKQLLATIPPHMRDVKTKGIPYLGAGAIYPIPEDEFVIQPFEIPHFWPKTFGFDPGWNKTAAIWGAYNQAEDCWYLYSEYYRGQSEPEVHAGNVLAKGKWMTGVCDPHGIHGGKGVAADSFLDSYEKLGLNLMLASPAGPGSVELGINEIYSRLSTGRLKVFSTLQNWLYEYRIYRRDDKGKVVMANNHLMDATRYLILCGASTMTTFTREDDYREKNRAFLDSGRSETTGY